jgi:SAM-dependent methyltransferase
MNSVWDNLAQTHYYRLSGGRDITFHKIFLPVIVDTIQEQAGFNTYSVLDVGCGTGYLTGLISNYARSVLGIDSSKASIDIAVRHNKHIKNIDFKYEDIKVFSNSHKQAFDFAISHLVLHVIEDLDMSLRTISACLKKGSRFLFSIPHPCFWALSRDVGTWNFNKINDYKYNKPSVQQNSINIDGNEFITPYFHRPIQLYFSALDKSGFTVERIIEPFPDKKLLQENHKRPWRFPRFIFLMCIKN